MGCGIDEGTLGLLMVLYGIVALKLFNLFCQYNHQKYAFNPFDIN